MEFFNEWQENIFVLVALLHCQTFKRGFADKFSFIKQKHIFFFKLVKDLVKLDAYSCVNSDFFLCSAVEV